MAGTTDAELLRRLATEIEEANAADLMQHEAGHLASDTYKSRLGMIAEARTRADELDRNARKLRLILGYDIRADLAAIEEPGQVQPLAPNGSPVTPVDSEWKPYPPGRGLDTCLPTNIERGFAVTTYPLVDPATTDQAIWTMLRDGILEDAAKECESILRQAEEVQAGPEGLSGIGDCIGAIRAMKGTP